MITSCLASTHSQWWRRPPRLIHPFSRFFVWIKNEQLWEKWQPGRFKSWALMRAKNKKKMEARNWRNGCNNHGLAFFFWMFCWVATPLSRRRASLTQRDESGIPKIHTRHANISRERRRNIYAHTTSPLDLFHPRPKSRDYPRYSYMRRQQHIHTHVQLFFPPSPLIYTHTHTLRT